MSRQSREIDMTSRIKSPKVHLRDLAEIIVGGLVLAFPVAVTEEVWNLSVELPLGRVILISFGSLIFIACFVQTSYKHTLTASSQKELAIRVLTVYGVTILVAATVLAAVDRLHLFTDTLVAIKRTIIVAFPASFAATVVDSFGD
jgi:uncharacterized membrane protein